MTDVSWYVVAVILAALSILSFIEMRCQKRFSGAERIGAVLFYGFMIAAIVAILLSGYHLHVGQSWFGDRWLFWLIGLLVAYAVAIALSLRATKKIYSHTNGGSSHH